MARSFRFVAVASVVMALGYDLPFHAAGPASLSVAGRASANVSLAADGNFVALAWAASSADGATTDIYASTSRDGGTTMSAPVRVNSTAGDARANGEQPPRVVLIANGAMPQISVVWLAKRTSGTVLLTSRSTDGGRTFAPAAVVAGSDAAGNRGWESIAADAAGTPLVAWLDHRRLAERDSQMAAMHHHEPGTSSPPTSATRPDGVAMAELSQIYFSRLDGSAAQPLTGGVCYCCKTAIAAGAHGEIFVAWRHVYAGNFRDIAFAASRDGGRTFSAPVRVSEDKWSIEGCPEDGPSMAFDRAGRLHIVWPTVVTENNEPVKALFHAVSRDGKTFGERTRIAASGQANHPQLALAGDGSLAVAWDESGNGARRIAIARGTIAADGRVAFRRMTASPGELGSYPVLSGTTRGLITAWTTGDPARSVIRIEEIR